MLGKNGSSGKQQEQGVDLDPQDAFDQALISFAAWCQELKTRKSVLDQAAAGLRQAGRYPPSDFWSGLVVLAERTEMSLLRDRPELFGGPPKEPEARKFVRECRLDLQQAQEGFERVRKVMTTPVTDTDAPVLSEGERKALMTQLQDWAFAIRRSKQRLSGALRQCPDLTREEMREITELAKADKESVTLTF